MIYQGRSAALAPIYLLHRDFTVEGEPEVLAQDPSLDVRRFAWSADGTLGAFLYADLMVGIDPGVDVHALTDGISALTFGDDAETVYAVRVGADGGNDVAVVLAIDQVTHEERDSIASRYPRPEHRRRRRLAEAQFSDEGGSVRLYWMHDGGLRLWVLGGGAWDVDPTDGKPPSSTTATLPMLWAPDGDRRIDLAAQEGNETTITLVDRSGDEIATATVTGAREPPALVAARRPGRVHPGPIRPTGASSRTSTSGTSATRAPGADHDHEHRRRLRRRVARQPEPLGGGLGADASSREPDRRRARRDRAADADPLGRRPSRRVVVARAAPRLPLRAVRRRGQLPRAS